MPKLNSSSGKFIESHTEITEEEYLKQIRYHAVYPVVWKYVFDKKLLKLSFSLSSLPKPRSAIEQKYIYNKEADDYYFEKTRDLTDEESALIFSSHKKSKTYDYPHCEGEGAYSLQADFKVYLQTSEFSINFLALFKGAILVLWYFDGLIELLF